MKGNLNRLDTRLIHSGLALLALAVILGLPLLRYELAMANSLSTMWPVLIIFAAPLALLAAGIFLRQRETRVEAIWREVSTHGEVPVASLLEISGFSPAQLRKALRRINQRAAVQLKWDEKASKVIDTGSRLQVQFAHSAQCAGCGATVSVNVTAHMDPGEVQCQYCSRAVDSKIINELQSKLHERASARGDDVHSQLRCNEMIRFNLPIFVVLLAIFWPGAIAYAIWRSKVAGAGSPMSAGFFRLRRNRPLPGEGGCRVYAGGSLPPESNTSHGN